MWELRVRRDGWSVEEGLAKGREPPEWWDEEPELLQGDGLFLRAYWALDSERAGPMMRIPWSKVMAYGARIGLEPRACDWLWDVISAMDEGHLAFMARSMEKQEAKATRAARRRSKKPGKTAPRSYRR